MTPKGGRDAIEGWSADEAARPVLKVRVSAAPADGAANAAVLALVAKALKVPRWAVRIASGETSRIKRLEIDGAAVTDNFRRGRNLPFEKQLYRRSLNDLPVGKERSSIGPAHTPGIPPTAAGPIAPLPFRSPPAAASLQPCPAPTSPG